MAYGIQPRMGGSSFLDKAMNSSNSAINAYGQLTKDTGTEDDNALTVGGGISAAAGGAATGSAIGSAIGGAAEGSAGGWYGAAIGAVAGLAAYMMG
jgi:hypothetical protein